MDKNDGLKIESDKVARSKMSGNKRTQQTTQRASMHARMGSENLTTSVSVLEIKRVQLFQWSTRQSRPINFLVRLMQKITTLV